MELTQFFCFAKTKKVDGVEVVTDYPVEIGEVAAATTVTDMVALINNPPPGFISVALTDPPTVDQDFFVIKEEKPILVNGVWRRNFVPTEKSLEEVDALVKQERRFAELRINEGRERANYHFFPFRGKRIACDTLSRSDLDGTNHHITNLGGVMPPNWVGGWKTKDNEVIPFNDVVTWREMYGAMYNQGQINFMHSQTLKALVKNANTLAEIRSIDWRTKTNFDATPLPEHELTAPLSLE